MTLGSAAATASASRHGDDTPIKLYREIVYWGFDVRERVQGTNEKNIFDAQSDQQFTKESICWFL